MGYKLDADLQSRQPHDRTCHQRRPELGSAGDLLRISVERTSGWPKNPRSLAGHLRRAQTFLWALGIEITFSREGRAESRVIRMRNVSRKYRQQRPHWARTRLRTNISRVRPVPFVTTAVDMTRAQPCRCSVGSQAMLTVLTQRIPFLSGNWDDSHWSASGLICERSTQLRLTCTLRRQLLFHKPLVHAF